MNRFLFAFLCCCLGLSTLHAQLPERVVRAERSDRAATEARMMCTSNAGTIQDFGPFFGQSNDVDPDTIYLCAGDSLYINHANDFDLSGDPVMSTPGGVGYAFYECPPSISGPTLSDIVNDPCTLQDLPNDSIFVATGGVNDGDFFFINTGTIQNLFNAGDPVLIWFAPITFDARDNTNQIEYEGDPPGECVNVSVEETFAVVYLNEMTVTDLDVGMGTGCLGSFRLNGGLPEFESFTGYFVDIYLQSDPSVQGQITNTAQNSGDLVEFFVPQPGTYVVEVNDGKSCDLIFDIQMGTCQPVTFQFPLLNALPGENICVDFTTTDFVNVASLQGSISWDPTILDFTNVQGFNPNMPEWNAVSSFNQAQPGVLTFTWSDAVFDGVTLTDGSTIFQVCFDVIGQLGDCSPIDVINAPTPIEVGDPSTPQQQYGYIIRDGKINVSSDPFFVLLEQDSLSCFDLDDGAFTVTADQGLAPYQIAWNTVPPSGPNNIAPSIPVDGGSTTVTDLAAGEYQVIVTDANNEQVVDTIEVIRPPFLSIDLIVTQPTCFDLEDGSVTAELRADGIVVADPIAEGYTFTWDPLAPNTDMLDGLAPGSYSVTVTNPSGCTVIAVSSISPPPPLRILSNNTFITETTCTGANNGSIMVTASGGTTASGDYFYQWDNGLGSVVATSSTVSNLDEGTYCVTVTDDNGCLYNDCFMVGAVKSLSIVGVTTDASCFGECDGTIFVTGNTTGAAADLPYTFSWSNVGSPPVNTGTTSQLNALCQGTYILTMTDSDPAGCQVVDTFMIAEPLPLITEVMKTDETCAVGNDGTITITVNGGTFPYSYSWSHDAGLQDSVATGLSEGQYTVDISDANNCSATLTIDINAPTPPQIITLDDDFVSCPGDTDGTLTVVAAPGNSPIAGIVWSTGTTGPTITTLSPGDYTVTVTDNLGCFTVDTASVLAPPPLVIDSFSLVLPSCPDENDGQIAVFASGGTTPYSFQWSVGPAFDDFNPIPGLVDGDYSVTVTDANNCESVVGMVNLPDPPTIVVSFSNLVDVSCPNDNTCDGGAMATAQYSDGTPGSFTFTWDSGEQETGVSSSTASQLCRGTRTLTVGDGACGVTVEVMIGSPEDITAAVNSQNVSCNGGADGSITLSLSGGTPPYDILWVGQGTTGPTIDNLVAGFYTAQISDDNGCTHEQTVEIIEPALLVLSIDPSLTTNNVSCAGAMDGMIAVSVNTDESINALGPNPYTWSDGIADPSSNIASNLGPGTYSVTVTDVKGCQDELSFTIGEPIPIVFTLGPIVEPLCFGEPTFVSLASVMGGVGIDIQDYTFIVDNNGLPITADQPAVVFAGNHTIEVFDANGCSTTEDIFIDQPDEIVVSLPEEIEIELGDSTVQLMPTVSPLIDNYMYFWMTDDPDALSSDTIKNPFVLAQTSQLATLTVTNDNGCQASADIFIEIDANRNVYIPNVFSPNNDGRNDEFRVFGCRGVTSIDYVRIFDRWGDLLYESPRVDPSCEDGTKLWNGDIGINGKPAQTGVYVYMVQVSFLDGAQLLYRGDVTLLR